MSSTFKITTKIPRIPCEELCSKLFKIVIKGGASLQQNTEEKTFYYSGFKDYFSITLINPTDEATYTLNNIMENVIYNYQITLYKLAAFLSESEEDDELVNGAFCLMIMILCNDPFLKPYFTAQFVEGIAIRTSGTNFVQSLFYCHGFGVDTRYRQNAFFNNLNSFIVYILNTANSCIRCQYETFSERVIPIKIAFSLHPENVQENGKWDTWMMKDLFPNDDDVGCAFLKAKTKIEIKPLWQRSVNQRIRIMREYIDRYNLYDHFPIEKVDEFVELCVFDIPDMCAITRLQGSQAGFSPDDFDDLVEDYNHMKIELGDLSPIPKEDEVGTGSNDDCLHEQIICTYVPENEWVDIDLSEDSEEEDEKAPKQKKSPKEEKKEI